MKYIKKINPVVRNLLGLTIGTSIGSAAIAMFLAPAEIMGGGVAGVSILLYSVLGWDIALTTFLIKVPIFVAGYILIDRKFAFYSMYVIIISPSTLKFFEMFPSPTSSQLIAVIVSGVLFGSSSSMMYFCYGSPGGFGTIARIIHKYFSIRMGTASYALSFTSLTTGAYFLGFDQLIMSLLMTFISGSTINFLTSGMHYKRSVIIVSERADEIRLAIMASAERTPTMWVAESEGSIEKKVLYCVVDVSQIAKVRNEMKKIDPEAFLSISECVSVEGGGYAPLFAD